MSVYKEGKSWKVEVYYKDWQGNRKRKQKRGFRTKGEAREWERGKCEPKNFWMQDEFDEFLKTMGVF